MDANTEALIKKEHAMGDKDYQWLSNEDYLQIAEYLRKKERLELTEEYKQKYPKVQDKLPIFITWCRSCQRVNVTLDNIKFSKASYSYPVCFHCQEKEASKPLNFK